MSSKQTSPSSSGTARPRSRAASLTPLAAIVVEGEDRGGRSGKIERQPQRGVPRQTRVDRARLCDELRSQLDPCRLERLPVPAHAVARRGNVVRLGEHRDAPVPESDQVIDEESGARDAVSPHEVAVEPGQRAVDEHERGLAAVEQPQVGGRTVAHRGDEHAVDLEGEHVGDVAALAREVGLRVAENDVVAGAPGDVFGAPDDEREERVRDVRDDQADRLRLAPDEPARDPVREVPERRDRRLDPPSRLVPDARLVVDHARDGHRGDTRPACDVPNRNSHNVTIT